MKIASVKSVPDCPALVHSIACLCPSLAPRPFSFAHVSFYSHAQTSESRSPSWRNARGLGLPRKPWQSGSKSISYKPHCRKPTAAPFTSMQNKPIPGYLDTELLPKLCDLLPNKQLVEQTLLYLKRKATKNSN